MSNELQKLYLNVKLLLENGKLVNELRKIRDAYEILVEPEIDFTFDHTFSRDSFMKFEKAVRSSTEDKREGFQQYLNKLIGEKDLSQTIISRRSGIKESTLSRFVSGSRTPSVDMVFRIALALRLNLVETETLLRKLNKGFSNTPKDGVMIEALKQKIYDYLKVEAVLRKLTNAEESLLSKKEIEEIGFAEEDWEIEISD
ncbi:helix-turn-helix domain-containing protein [Oceanobacillus senegalensis]|uniref:helix-turn-helix domain-containing protein n=1 Tax=Oceanobacillus senegalensis TaxID=1936063 RepID=UPI000A304B7D|nr:helix-turn-helix transcriptional regulator [Oceanobacillus senegalensis]